MDRYAYTMFWIVFHVGVALIKTSKNYAICIGSYQNIGSGLKLCKRKQNAR